MKIKRQLALVIALAALQTVNLAGQELFRVGFNGTARPGGGVSGSTRLTTRDLIVQCVGTGFSASEISRNFALVYNVTSDSIQVVNRGDASVVCEEFRFQGGTSTIVNGSLVRFTFVFAPDQTDAIGSAVITERSDTVRAQRSFNRARISGKMQFTRATPTGPGAPTDVNDAGNFVQTEAAASVTADQQICTGTFVVGRAFVPDDTVPTTSTEETGGGNDLAAEGTTGTGGSQSNTNAPPNSGSLSNLINQLRLSGMN